MNQFKHPCSRGLRLRPASAAGLAEASYSVEASYNFARTGGARRGSLLIELIASLGVLTTVMAVATPLVVRHGRIMTSVREYRIAVEELSNQLERLTALPEDELRAQVSEIEASKFAAERLHGAKLTAALAPADIGERLTLELIWDEPQRRGAPVRLVAWIAPAPAATDATAAPDDEEAP